MMFHLYQAMWLQVMDVVITLVLQGSRASRPICLGGMCGCHDQVEDGQLKMIGK